MATVLIGDFRGKQLHRCKDSSSFIFITDDNAEYSWFNTSAIKQLPLYSIDKANVIIMLGFNDCVYSCIWDSFNLDKIVANYVNTINKLIKDYPDFKFYVCSVTPVDSDYPFVAGKNKSIPFETLDKKIKRFNAKLMEMCDATFLDSYNYLMRTGFETRDGVRYTPDSCDNLATFINSNLSALGGTVFKSRLAAPIVDDTDLECDLFWLGDSYNGLNPFDNLGQTYAKCTGDTLPNCTAYAWGRFYEILGTKPLLSTGNAERWYSNTSDGYKRGQTPALGAIACWCAGSASSGSDGAGHVAIVEKINSDGSIVTSESGWNSSKYWWTTTRSKGSDGNWGQGSAYTFQGFIYCPLTSQVSEVDLCTKNSYNITVDEMKPNAQYIWQYLGARGWTINAVAGLLGNLQQESKMSPASWESTISGSVIQANGKQVPNLAVIREFYKNHGRYPGYGLVQWTPYHNYTYWCDSNKLPYWEMSSQLQRIDWEVLHGDQWIARPSKGYNLSFSDFIASTKEPSWLAAAFAFCYERPGRSTGTAAEQEALRKERGENGTYWYNFLSSLQPITSDAKLRVENLRITKCTGTMASVAFLATNAAKITYTLNNKSKKEVKIAKSATIIELQNLVPNKKYTLTLHAIGADDSELSKTLSFTTPQDYPESISDIELLAKDTLLPHDSFQLKAIPAKPDFGYWKGNGHGYAVQLFVNGSAKSEKIVNSLQTNFKISDYFGYEPELGDIVQVGIRTWAVDDSGKKVYDSSFAKCSNPICMLASPIAVYINND